MTRLVVSLIGSALLFWAWSPSNSVAAEKGEATVATLLSRVQARYAKIDRMSASFKQVTFNATLKREEVSSGIYYAEKPGKVRWDYKKPKPQHLLIVAGRVEFYVPADRQLIVSQAGQQEELKALLDFLGGRTSLLERFKVRLVDNAGQSPSPNRYRIRVVPRETFGNLLRLDLLVNKKTLLVEQTEYWDIYGNRTNVSFSDIRMPKSFEPSLFSLAVPKGVSVIDSAGNPVESYFSAKKSK